MTTTIECQTLAFGFANGMTALLFPPGNDTAIVPSSPIVLTEATNRHGVYTFTAPSVGSPTPVQIVGLYQVDLYLSGAVKPFFSAWANVPVSGTIRCEDSYFTALMGPLIAAITAGLGVVTVTITVNDGTNPIQNARVSLSISGSTYTATTNSSGVAVLTPNQGNGAYSVAISAQNYEFTPTSLVVSGNTSQTYLMTQITITPSSPGFVTGYGTCFDQDGNVEANVSVSLVMQTQPTGSGSAFSSLTRTTISASNGVYQFPGMVIGGAFQVSRGTGAGQNVVAADGGGGTCALPNLLGP